MRNRIRIFYLSLFVCSQACAQEAPLVDSSKSLEGVVVTYQADKLTPITYQNIVSKDIQARSTGQEPSFLLSETPSVTNYSDAGNSQGYSYYRIRGIDQTRINMSLDGAPLNEPEDQGAYFSNYPDVLNSVSKIQIQRGVGMSKNGVASYGGSVQLFSPNLYDSAKTTVGLGFGSFNSLRVFGEYKSGMKNGRAIYARGSQIYSDGYKYHSSNNSRSVFLSSGLYRERSTWKMNVLVGHQQNKLAWLGVSDSLIAIDRRTNVNTNEKDGFTQCLLQLQQHWRMNKWSNLQSSIYYSSLKGNYDFNLNGFFGLPTTMELYNYAFRSNFIGFFSNYSFTKARLCFTTGVQGNVYDRKHIGSELTYGQFYANRGFKNEASVFAKVDYKVNKLLFFADIQYRYSSFDYKGSARFDKMQWHFINPKAGLSVRAGANSIIYYSVGSANREPTRNDLFGGNDDLSSDSAGNGILSIKTPEYVFNQELGWRKQTRRLNLNLNLFYMNFKNEIVLDGKFGPNGLALTNKVDRSFRAGVELSLGYKLSDRITLVNNASYNYSCVKAEKETFTHILTPPVIINQEAVYAYKRFSLAVSARYQDKSFMDYANTASLNSYVLLNGRFGYDVKNVQLCFFVNNIGNTTYFNAGYVDFDGTKKYFVQAPTTLYASLKWSF